MWPISPIPSAGANTPRIPCHHVVFDKKHEQSVADIENLELTPRVSGAAPST